MQTAPSWWAYLFGSPHKTEYRFIIDGRIYDASHIMGVPVIEKPLMQEPTFGRCCTGSLTITILPIDGVEIPKAAEVSVDCRLVSDDQTRSTAWVPQGRYYVASRSITGKKITLNCRDKMILTGQTYTDKTQYEEWPQKMTVVLDEILDILGVELDSRTYINPAYTVDYPNEDSPIAEILGMIAAAHGGSFIMTESGKLRLVVFPDTGTSVMHLNRAYMEMQLYSHGARSISRVTLSDIADNIYTTGDDTGIEISAACDYATQQIANAIGANLIGHAFQGYLIRGAYINPLLEIGDTFTAVFQGVTYNLIANSITITCSKLYTAVLENGVEEDDEEEYPYQDISNIRNDRKSGAYISSLKSYFGNRINRAEGFVSELVHNGNPVARLVANGETFTMQKLDETGAWVDCIYFNTTQSRYEISGDVKVEGAITSEDLSTGGRTTINGANISTGSIQTDQVTIEGSTFFRWDGENIYIINPRDTNQQIHIGAYDGANLGIGYTKDGGETWSTAMDFNGLHFTSGDYSKVYVSETEPTGGQYNVGDIWLESAPATKWGKLHEEYTWGEVKEKLWQEYVRRNAVNQYYWDGEHWILANDYSTEFEELHTEINQNRGEIQLLAQHTERNIQDVNTRVSEAEQKITPEAITNTVTSSTVYRNTIDGLNGSVDKLDKTINGNQGVLSRLQSAEQKITPEAITNTVTASTTYRSDIGGLNTRLNSAEQKITDEAITSTVTSSTAFTNLQNTANAKCKTYAQTTAPSGSGLATGDLWIDTDDSNKLYRYNGRTWDVVRDTQIALNKTAIEQNSKEIELRVEESTLTGQYLTSKINLTSNTASIDASHIDLKGYVTAADGRFSIDQNGYLKCSGAEVNGKFSAGYWTFNSVGAIYDDKNGKQIYLTVQNNTQGELRAFVYTDGAPMVVGVAEGYTLRLEGEWTRISAYTCDDSVIVSSYDSMVQDSSHVYEEICLYPQSAGGSYGDNQGYGRTSKGNIGTINKRWDVLWARIIHYSKLYDASSRSVKHDIKPMQDFGPIIDQLQPVSFVYNEDMGEGDDTRYGLIYEDTLPILPEICYAPPEEDLKKGERVGIEYNRLIPILLNEIKSLRARVKALEER